MSIVQTIVLAIIEGITEFLPISSTGHLILAATALHIEQTAFVKSFEIIIQLGAILGVVVLYWRRIVRNFRLWKMLFVAFLPSMVIGLLLYKTIKSLLLGNPYITLIALFVGGLAILLLEYIYKGQKRHTDSLDQITIKQALITGICQSISVIPGVSRAAATILGGMGTGMSRTTAVEFSFLLAIPTMLAATVLDVSQSLDAFTTENLPLLLLGFVVSLLVAIVSVKWLLHFVKTNTLIPFGMYRIILSLLYFLFIL